MSFEDLPPKLDLTALDPLSIVDLNQLSHADLMDMSRKSASNPFEALLDDPPGVLPSRQAYMTGMFDAENADHVLSAAPAADQWPCDDQMSVHAHHAAHVYTRC